MSNLPSNEFKPYFSKDDYQKLIKSRIIQKNLVHFQGFPNSLADPNLLIQPGYFGQFGKILKIVLVSKNDENTKKKSNSAYITFSTNEEAAYAVLVMDSLLIENNLVRCFFGTSKYCIHFLNNIECYNKEKCMYIHSIADDNEIIGVNSKFGYNEHLKLAKKIIGFGSFENRNYVMNLIIPFPTIFPNIKSIYLKEDYFSDNNTTFSSIGNNLSSSWSSKSSDSNRNICYPQNKNDVTLFRYKDESRFFSKGNNINNLMYNFDISDSLKNLIDDIFLRINFFKKFEHYYPFKESIKEFCKKKYEMNNDSWIDNEINNIEQRV